MTEFSDWFRKNAKPDEKGNLSVPIEEVRKAFPHVAEGLQREADRIAEHERRKHRE